MTAAQVFNWFCKEQNIMSNIMMIYNTVRPRCNQCVNDTIQLKYLTYEEFIELKLKNGSFMDLFMNVQNAYLYTFGWYKYEEYSRKIDLLGLNKKWRYFASHNICIHDDCLKVGDVIDYKLSGWRRWDAGFNGFIDDVNRKGRVDSINVGYGVITIWDEVDNQHRTYYANEFYDMNGSTFNLDINFYIKRNRRKYYGRNHGR